MRAGKYCRSDNQVRLYVGGLGLQGDGYPNAVRTVELLQEMEGIEVIQCGSWLPDDLHLWKLPHMPRARAVRWLSTLVLGNLRSLFRVIGQIRKVPGPVYVPYPGIFFLLWASLLPSAWRPYCIVDSYISIWDSMFRDRAGNKSRSRSSRALRWLESRALRAASRVLVDTDANRDAFIQEFGLDPSRVDSIPLAIDETRILVSPPLAPRDDAGRIRVLFVGTLIPLHGISVVLDAFARLVDDARYEFRLIGTGQQAQLVADFMAAHPPARIEWIQKWCTLDQIASEILKADICLGVFGGEGKASRVLPFKLYMYFASARAVISQSQLSTPGGVPLPPIEAVSPIRGIELAQAINHLADNPMRRARLQAEAAAYYRRWLANSHVTSIWRDMLATRSW